MLAQLDTLSELHPAALASTTRLYYAQFVAGTQPLDPEHLPQSYPPSFMNWHPSKQAEFSAGRQLAEYALKHQGSVITSLTYQEQQAPLWPQGYLGSISHKSDRCVVCLTSDVKTYLGIDLELWFNEDKAQNIAPRILTTTEHQFATQIDLARLCCLIFSAKETLYKALYPKVQQFFGFQDASIVELDLEHQSYQIQILRTLSPEITQGIIFQGSWIEHPEHVITYMQQPVLPSQSNI
tara:strand:- start:1690 stop:2403 length:714 start_codon:yes stop_codon:yes gene_type:complete